MFLEDESRAAVEFKSKPRVLASRKPLKFNGTWIRKRKDGRTETVQTDKIEGMKGPHDQKSFDSQRALSQYIGVCTRPDVCANVQLISKGAEPSTSEEHGILSRTIRHLQNTKDMGLTYEKLDMESVKLVLITDASFSNARKLKSQLRYVVLMMDGSENANIIHYGSSRGKRVARSILSAEIHALVLGYDQAYVVRDLVEELLGKEVSLEAYVDSRSVFEVLAKDDNTTEKWLQIDIHALRKSYSKGELDRIGWISGDSNPADEMTKVSKLKSNPLTRLMTSNFFHIDGTGWE